MLTQKPSARSPQVLPRLRWLIGSVVLVALSYCSWRYLLQWFFLQRDDFWLVTITDRPYGRFGLSDFFWSWRNDWFERNGRSADALVRLLLRPGEAVVGWIAPAIVSLCAAAGWRWLPDHLAPASRIVAQVLMLTTIPVALLVNPSVAGNTVFWAAGLGNYVVPTALAIFATAVWSQPSRSTTSACLGGVLIICTGLLHEIGALSVFFVANAWLILNRRRMLGSDALLLGASYVALFLGFIGPGRWRRFDALVGNDSGPAGLVAAAAKFTSELLLETTWVWVFSLVFLTLAVAAVVPRGDAIRARSLGTVLAALWASSLTALLLARAWRSEAVGCSQTNPLADESRAQAILMLVAILGSLIAAGLLIARLRTDLGDEVALLGVGLIATMPLPLATGQCAPRVWYPPLIWLTTLLVVILVRIAGELPRPRTAISVAALLATTLAVRFGTEAEPALRANHASFHQVLAQIKEIPRSGPSTIWFPVEVPYPRYGKAPVYRIPSIACGFRTYYDVPTSAVLDDGSAPEAGLPDYCPRPDSQRRPVGLGVAQWNHSSAE